MSGRSRAEGGAITAIVVMGVAGSGKSTIGTLLAERLGWTFRDADDFHPPANVAKMSAGTPLTDEDRWPWLAAIGAWLDEGPATGARRIVTCSALKRIYRDRLIAGREGVRLVYLDGSMALIAERMRARRDHFMPPALLESQFAALEPPGEDEAAVKVGVDAAPGHVVDAVLQKLLLISVAEPS